MEEILRAFIAILADIGISQKTIVAITVMLMEKSEAMDALVDWIEENPHRSEKEVIKKATDLYLSTSTTTEQSI
jgi:hypothetical protein